MFDAGYVQKKITMSVQTVQSHSYCFDSLPLPTSTKIEGPDMQQRFVDQRPYLCRAIDSIGNRFVLCTITHNKRRGKVEVAENVMIKIH